MAKSILFVDDEFSPDTSSQFGGYMSFYKEALVDAGYAVMCVRSTDEAIETAGVGRFELAILDIMMPPGKVFQAEDTKKGLMTGFFLAQRLNEIDPAMPIVFLSNAGGNQGLFAKHFDDSGVRDVLFKLDVTPHDLVKKLDGFFQRRDEGVTAFE